MEYWFWFFSTRVNHYCIHPPFGTYFFWGSNMSNNDWLAVNVGGEKTFLGRFPVGLFGTGGIGYQTRQAPKWLLSELRWLIIINNDYQWVLSNNMLTLMFPMLQLQKTCLFSPENTWSPQGGYLASLTHTRQLCSSYQFLGVDDIFPWSCWLGMYSAPCK